MGTFTLRYFVKKAIIDRPGRTLVAAWAVWNCKRMSRWPFLICRFFTSSDHLRVLHVQRQGYRVQRRLANVSSQENAP